MADFIQRFVNSIGLTAALTLAGVTGIVLGALIAALLVRRPLQQLRRRRVDEIEQWEQERAAFAAKEKQTQAALRTTRAALESLREKANKAAHVIVDLRKVKASLAAEKDSLTSKLLENETAAAERIAKLERDVQTAEVRLRNDAATIDGLQNQAAAGQANGDRLQATVKSLQDEVAAYQGDINRLQQEKQAVLLLKDDFEGGIHRLEEALQKSAQERANLQTRNERLIQEFRQAEQSRVETHGRLEEAERFVQTVRDELPRLIQENAGLRHAIDESKKQLDVYRQESVAQDEKFNRVLDDFQHTSGLYNQRVVEVSRLLEKLDDLAAEKTALQEDLDQLNGHLGRVSKLEGRIWERAPSGDVFPFVPLTERRAKIIAVFNLKGGVGKTAITANLGAMLWRIAERPTLLVDLDYQGTLSERCLEEHVHRELCGCVANVFSSDGDDRLDIDCLIKRVEPDAEGYVLPATFRLFESEDHTMARWLMKPDDGDVRFLLRRLLHDPEISDRYEFILLDCPPRMTTAAVNALGCADYVLVPTVPDKDSAERVPHLLEFLRRLKPHVCPNLSVLGVVGNMARFYRGKLIDMQDNYWMQLKEKLHDVEGEAIYQFEALIPHFGAKWRHRFETEHPPAKEHFLKLLDEFLMRTQHHERRLAEVVS